MLLLLFLLFRIPRLFRIRTQECFIQSLCACIFSPQSFSHSPSLFLRIQIREHHTGKKSQMYSIVGEMKRVVTVWVRKNLCFSLPTQFFLFISQKCLQILYQCAFRRCSRLMNSTFDGTEAPEPRSLKSRTFKAENLVDVKDFRDSYLLLVIFQSTVSSIIERPSSKFWRTFFRLIKIKFASKENKNFLWRKNRHTKTR